MDIQKKRDLRIYTMQKNDISCNFILSGHFLNGITSSEKYHFHSFYELFAVVTGNMHIMIENQDFFLTSGDICIIPPNTPHFVYEDKDSFRIGFRFSYSSSGNFSNSCYLSRFQRSYGKLKTVFITKDPSIYENYLCVAARILKSDHSNYVINELLFYAINQISNTILHEPAVSETTQNSDSLRTIYIEDFINHNYYANTRIEDLANTLNLSVRQTERVVSRLFGISFTKLVLKKRLSIAKFLLQKTPYSIEEIAFQTGFYDKSHFCHKFTYYYDITPVKYRAEHQV